jgi:hypothetical protein
MSGDLCCGFVLDGLTSSDLAPKETASMVGMTLVLLANM